MPYSKVELYENGRVSRAEAVLNNNGQESGVEWRVPRIVGDGRERVHLSDVNVWIPKRWQSLFPGIKVPLRIQPGGTERLTIRPDRFSQGSRVDFEYDIECVRSDGKVTWAVDVGSPVGVARGPRIIVTNISHLHTFRADIDQEKIPVLLTAEHIGGGPSNLSQFEDEDFVWRVSGNGVVDEPFMPGRESRGGLVPGQYEVSLKVGEHPPVTKVMEVGPLPLRELEQHDEAQVDGGGEIQQ